MVHTKRFEKLSFQSLSGNTHTRHVVRCDLPFDAADPDDEDVAPVGVFLRQGEQACASGTLRLPVLQPAESARTADVAQPPTPRTTEPASLDPAAATSVAPKAPIRSPCIGVTVCVLLQYGDWVVGGALCAPVCR